MKYAKALVAALGTAASAALATVPPNTTLWQVLTAIVAVATVVGVYYVPNKIATPSAVTPPGAGP